jgi:hypothetical protein
MLGQWISGVQYRPAGPRGGYERNVTRYRLTGIRPAPVEYAYLVLRPEQIQAWREENGRVGRTLMRSGDWLI